MPPSIDTILAHAIEIPSAEDRNKYLADNCDGDPRLRAEVDRLIACHFAAGDFLDTEVTEQFSSGCETAGKAVGTLIGPYKILEEIGEGGFGVVYMAEQMQPIRRRVAIKILKPGMDTRQVIARFEAERQALALMDHPNIAKVLDAGSTETGRPYFVMELVKGETITSYCQRLRLSMKDRLQLFIATCAAIQHAHQKGIIHRDIKPGNVLVTSQDGQPLVKVIDFGIAKALGQQLTDKTLFTGFSQMIGTPLYMSPEQIALSNVDVDVRSDVYSLGVLLYELLTSTTPISKEALADSSYDEMRRLIQESDPPLPSDRVSTLKSQGSLTAPLHGSDKLRTLCHQLRGEVDWIVMQALDKERSRRYQSASELAADVQRYLNDAPVLACPPTLAYRVSKLVRRHSLAFSVVAIIAITLLAATLISLRYASVAIIARVDTDNARKLADERRISAEQSASNARLQAEQAKKFEAEATQQRDQANQSLYNADVRFVSKDVEARNAWRASDTLLRHLPYSGDQDLRGWEWYYLLAHSHEAAHTIYAHRRAVMQVSWSPDATLAATVSHDGTTRIWDTNTWRQIREIRGRCLLYCTQWSPDGRFLAWGASADDCRLRIWDRDADSVAEYPGHQSSLWSLAWSPDGKRIATVGMRPNGVKVWNFDGDMRATTLDEVNEHLNSVSWHPKASQIAAVGRDWSLYFWDVTTGNVNKTTDLATLNCSCCQWHPREHIIAIGKRSGECVLWDPEAKQVRQRWRAHKGSIESLAWYADGILLATTGSDGQVKVWNGMTGELLHSRSGHRGRVNGVAWSPDGRQLISGGIDGLVHVWNLSKKRSPVIIQTDCSGAYSVEWTDEQTLRTLQDGPHPITDWSVIDGTIIKKHDLGSNISMRLWNERLATRLVSEATGNSHVELWDVAAGRKVQTLTMPGLRLSSKGENFFAAFNKPSNKLLIILAEQSPAVLFDLTSLSKRQTDQVLSSQYQAAWAPNGRMAASVGDGLKSDGGYANYQGYVHIFDGENGAYVRRFRIGDDRVRGASLAWSPDSNRIAAGNMNGLCEIYDVMTGSKLVSRNIHRSGVGSLAWSPDGRRLVSGSEEGDVRIWDCETGEELLHLGDHAAAIRAVRWSPSGRKLASASTDGVLHVWDATEGYSIAESDEWSHFIGRNEEAQLNALAERGAWAEAKIQCEKMLSRSRNKSEHWHTLATYIYLASQDLVGYRRQCLQLIDTLPTEPDPRIAAQTVWTCVLVPDTFNDYGAVLKLASDAAAQFPEVPLCRDVHGAVLMRAGRFREAQQELLTVGGDQSDPLQWPPRRSYLLAITAAHLGQTAEARRWLTHATEQDRKELEMAGNLRTWPQRLNIEPLQEEAIRLIGSAQNTKE